MKSLIPILVFCIALMCGVSQSVKAQISTDVEPYSFSISGLDESLVPVITLDKPDVEALLEEDSDRDREGLNLRDAVAIPVGLDIQNSGHWFNLENGDRLWRLTVKVPEALSLEAYYSNYMMPSGAQLFIYNEDGSEHFGGYTQANNKESGRMATEMIQGDVINFELYEPADKIGDSQLEILDLAYRYRDVIGVSESVESGGSDPCQVDVACSESEGWEDQVNSVVRVRTRINGQFFWCTGVVMNNTQQDCRPLLLTALHCAINGGTQSSASDLDLYRFYFKYQANSCDSGGGSTGNTISGCTRLADSNDSGGNSGSDFLLLEMANDIPENFDPYYAGWDAGPSAQSGGGVCVHHPSGDRKKISTYTVTPSSSSWGTSNTHWLVTWAGTENGHGVTEGGSSGSPLFDHDGRVVGTLTGGASFCEEVQPGGQNQPDFYGKMSHHWSNNPNSANEKLKEFLDPSGGTTLSFDGSANPCLNSIAELDDAVVGLSPVPADASLRVSLTQDMAGSYTIMDITGKEVMAQRFSNGGGFDVDVSGLQSGIYLINLALPSSKVLTKRFVVSH